MERLRIYVDTSVLGGCFDAEFVTWSEALVRDFRAKRLIPVLSDVTAAEVAAAPPAVRALHDELLTLSGGVLPITEEVLSLMQAYESRQILPKRYTRRHDAHRPRHGGRGRCRRELELQAHRPTREDSPLQRGQRRIGLPGAEHALAPRGRHL